MFKHCIITASALLIYAASYAQPVKDHGQLSVKGTQLVDKKGNAVSLRGISFGWHSFWPRFYNAGTVKWLQDDWNANVVRAAMGIEVGDHGKTYKEHPVDSKTKIKAVVDGAINEGIYVIIDWHSHNINLAEAKVFLTK